ncbi:MAG TPA: hypothetical protein VFU62_12260, partial [Hanamia sp.]|nr:hypothetical protein [Hanamia sp.]
MCNSILKPLSLIYNTISITYSNHILMKHIIAVCMLLLLFSCNQKKEVPLFELMDNTGINFDNKVTDGKLENSFLFRN